MFGFTLNGSAEKSKSTRDTTNSFTNTTTRNIPQWGRELVEKGAARVGEVFDLDPASQVAPANSQILGAAQAAANLPTSASADTSWLKPYMSADTPFASGGKAYDYIDRYLNPYLKSVVDASASDLDAQAGQVRAQQALDLAGSGAFGGSGAALTQSMTEGELARARATTLSGLRSHAYDTALGPRRATRTGRPRRGSRTPRSNCRTRARRSGSGFKTSSSNWPSRPTRAPISRHRPTWVRRCAGLTSRRAGRP